MIRSHRRPTQEIGQPTVPKFHPDLRRHTWYMPRDLGLPTTLRFHRAVPARLDDFSGLAPAWIGIGTCDLFHDEDIAYADRLTAAGVPCEVEEVPVAFHGFDITMPRAGVSRRVFDSRCAALRRAFRYDVISGG